MKNFMIVCLAALSFAAVGCKKKDGAGAAMSKMTEYKDKMCACKDSACAQKVSDEMTKWGQEQAKDNKEPPKMSEEETKKFTAIGEEMVLARAEMEKGQDDNCSQGVPGGLDVTIFEERFVLVQLHRRARDGAPGRFGSRDRAGRERARRRELRVRRIPAAEGGGARGAVAADCGVGVRDRGLRVAAAHPRVAAVARRVRRGAPGRGLP